MLCCMGLHVTALWWQETYIPRETQTHALRGAGYSKHGCCVMHNVVGWSRHMCVEGESLTARGRRLLNRCLPYKWITKRIRLAVHSESMFWWFKQAWCMTSVQNREQSQWKKQEEWTVLSAFCHLGLYYKSFLIFWPLEFSNGRLRASLINSDSDSGVRDRMDHTVLLRHMLSRFVRQLP